MTNQDARPETATLERDAWRRIVLERALDGLVGMDEHQRIIDWNRQAEVLFGWTRDEALGRTLPELIMPPSLREAHHRGFQHYLSTGEGPILNRRKVRFDSTPFFETSRSEFVSRRRCSRPASILRPRTA